MAGLLNYTPSPLTLPAGLPPIRLIPSEVWLGEIFWNFSARDLARLAQVNRFFRWLASEFIPHRDRMYNHPLLHLSVRHSFHLPELTEKLPHCRIPYGLIPWLVSVTEQQFTRFHLTHRRVREFLDVLGENDHPDPDLIKTVLSRLALKALPHLPNTVDPRPLFEFSVLTNSPELLRELVGGWTYTAVINRVDLLFRQAVALRHWPICHELISSRLVTSDSRLEALKHTSVLQEGSGYELGCKIMTSHLNGIKGKALAAVCPSDSPLSTHFLGETTNPAITKELLSKKLMFAASHGDQKHFFALCRHPDAASLPSNVWGDALIVMIQRSHLACIQCFFQELNYHKPPDQIALAIRFAINLQQMTTLQLIITYCPNAIETYQARNLMECAARSGNLQLARDAMCLHSFPDTSLDDVIKYFKSLPPAKGKALKTTLLSWAHSVVPNRLLFALQYAAYVGDKKAVTTILQSSWFAFDSKKYYEALRYAYDKNRRKIARILTESPYFSKLPPEYMRHLTPPLILRITQALQHLRLSSHKN